MARRVYALMPSSEAAEFRFAVQRGADWRMIDAASFTIRNNDDIIILVPGTDVSVHTVSLPARNEKEALRAAPFAIEDELAQAVEDVHVAIDRTVRDGPLATRTLYASSREKMAGWLGRADAAGLKAAAFVAEQSVLPEGDCIADTGERILFSCDGKQFAADTSVSDDVLRALAGTGAETPAIFGSSLGNRLGLEAMDERAAVDIRQLAAWAETAGPLTDLRQGAYAYRVGWQATDLMAWRVPAVLAAGCAFGWMAIMATETAVLNRQMETNNAKAQELYAEAFPDEGVVSDPARRVRSKAGSAAMKPSGLDFMTASAALYQAVSVTDGAVLKSLRYEDASGDLRASLLYPDHGIDVQIKSALEQAGFRARIGDTRQSGNRVIGELIVGGRP